MSSAAAAANNGLGFTIKSLSESTASSVRASPPLPPSPRGQQCGDLLELIYPPTHRHYKKSRLLLALIEQSVDGRRYWNPSTLQFRFQTSKGSTRQTSVSLVDYLKCALSKSAQPSAPTVALHRFLVSRCSVPRSLAINRILALKA
jgi:hypothetical protein